MSLGRRGSARPREFLNRPMDFRHLRNLVLLTLAAYAVGSGPLVFADLVRLKNGGELRGALRSEDRQDDEAVTVETLIGTLVSVRQDDVRFITRRSLNVEEYETRARRKPQTAEAQWELAEWCRQKGLTSQRESHLLRVTELDPKHEKAHLALGHTRQDGEWIDRDALMASRGYVKHKGRYITTQEMELIEKTQAELQAEREWHGKIRLWTNWLAGYSVERRQEGLAQLEQIREPNAVSAIARLMTDEPNRSLRELGVRILSRIDGPKPVKALVNISLSDVESDIRSAALAAIAPEQVDRAVPYYVKELKSERNAVVQRAGAALERFGDERVVAQLIDALITTHRYRVVVPGSSGNMNFSFGSDGSFASPATPLPPEVELMLRTGQLPYGAVVVPSGLPGPDTQSKVVMVRQDQRNEAVLAALQRITGEDFGYDERTWHLWWTAEKTGVTTHSAKK